MIELTIFVIGILYVVHFYFDVDNAVMTITMMVFVRMKKLCHSRSFYVACSRSPLISMQHL